MFNPSRLRVARKRRGLSKTRLAEAVGVDLRSVSAWENDEWTPTADTVDRLGKVLCFPPDFFAGSDLHEPTPDTASFRAMSRMSAGQRDAALSAGSIAFLLNDWIEKRFELPATDLPDLRGEDPEAAAYSLRQQWGLGERPIRNIVHLLEAKGVRVFSLAEDSVEVDAFSLWRSNTPFVFLNTKKSAEHGRFDAAHELAHLVLHRHGGPHGPQVEREAHAFASALLMPRASVLAVAPRVSTIEHLIQLKKHWTVSVAALAYRLHAIGVLTDWHYRTLCIELSQRGYRNSEPEGAQRETSQMLAKVFASLRSDGTTKLDVARDLYVEVDEVDRLVFGLILLGMAGNPASRNSGKMRPTLNIVK